MASTPTLEGEFKEGVVVEWNARGFGFVGYEDGSKAYVHTSACRGEHLVKGEIVLTTVVQDRINPGKWAVSHVERLQGAQVAAPSTSVGTGVGTGGSTAPECGRQDCVVSEWNERGFGFVDLVDGRRAYAHSSQCNGQTSLQVGEIVSAVIAPDSKNPEKYAAYDIHRGPEGVEAVVTEWREDGGFGFVLAANGQRAYVHRSATKGGKGSLVVGQKLRVTIQSDPRNPGKICVGSIKDGNVGCIKESKVALAPLSPLSSAGTPLIMAQAASAPFTQVDCTVEQWNDGAGFGFLQADDGRRIYIHRSAFGGQRGDNLPVSMRLRVVVKPDLKNEGKWCASSVVGELSPSAAPQKSEVIDGDEPQSGTVRDWNDQGGYGFLSMDDGRRVYIHRSTFGATGSLPIGQRMVVTTQADPRNKGKWSVALVLSMDAPPEEPAMKRQRLEFAA